MNPQIQPLMNTNRHESCGERPRSFCIGRWMLDVECWMFDAQGSKFKGRLNDEIRMPNDEGMTKPECPRRAKSFELAFSDFGHSGFIGHWSLVIGHLNPGQRLLTPTPTKCLGKRRDRVARHSGWTLIETIAVLAVIAILAAVIAPTIIRRVDRAAWTKETADLNSIADALTQSIIRTKTIPNYTDWPAAIASQASLPVSAVNINARRNARAFLV